MSEHVERLIDAIQSDEEWTGNRIKRRRRISFGLALTMAVVAIIAGVAAVPELRAVFSSPETKARNQLQSLGISLDVKGLEQALVGADGNALEAFLAAGMSTSQVAQALAEQYASENKSVAAIFFERSRNSPQALLWFSNILDKGLDPNLLVSHPYYQQAGILGSAIAEGNLDASLALLQHGASAHVYQEIWLTQYPIIRLLFPLDFVLENRTFTTEAKRDLIRAMIKGGVVTFKPGGHREGPMTTAQLDAIASVFTRTEKELGVDLKDTPPDQAGILRPNCNPIAKLTGFDWCNFADKLPNRFKLADGNSQADVYDMYLRNLVYASPTSGYFLTVLNLDSNYELPDIAVVETSRDGNEWTLYKFTRPGAGLGICKKDADGWTPDRCWRKFDIIYDEKARTLTLEDAATLAGTRE